MNDRDRLQRAWDLLAFLLGERPEPPAHFDAELVAQIAASDRLDAALAEPGFASVDPRDHLPERVWNAWQEARSRALKASAIRGVLLRRTLEDLRPFPIIIFKGLPTSELLYPSPGARDMSDVDLLVRGADLEPVMLRLRELGFAGPGAGAAELDRASWFEWTFSRPGLDLDLHRGWTYPARFRIDYREVFDRSLPWTSLADNARLHSPEDAFLCQALQGALTEFSPSAFPWVGMLDLREMLKPGPFWRGVSNDELNRGLVWRRASEWGVRSALAAALRAGGRLFASLRAIAAEAAPPLTPIERGRSVLGTLGVTPPGLAGDATLIRMARRFFLTPTPDLPAVAVQSAQRRWLHRASKH